tara:strand:+ start:1385 stop:1699 length:315 start_codon:yes stop_codon:yes gene_type:complete
MIHLVNTPDMAFTATELGIEKNVYQVLTLFEGRNASTNAENIGIIVVSRETDHLFGDACRRPNSFVTIGSDTDSHTGATEQYAQIGRLIENSMGHFFGKIRVVD